MLFIAIYFRGLQLNHLIQITKKKLYAKQNILLKLFQNFLAGLSQRFIKLICIYVLFFKNK